MTRACLTLTLLVLLPSSAALASPRQARIAACDRAVSQAERLELGCWRLRHRSPAGMQFLGWPHDGARTAIVPRRESRASRDHQRRRDWLRAKEAAAAPASP